MLLCWHEIPQTFHFSFSPLSVSILLRMVKIFFSCAFHSVFWCEKEKISLEKWNKNIKFIIDANRKQHLSLILVKLIWNQRQEKRKAKRIEKWTKCHQHHHQVAFDCSMAHRSKRVKCQIYWQGILTWICVKSSRKDGFLSEVNTSRTGADVTSFYAQMVHWSAIRIYQTLRFQPSPPTTSQLLVARSCPLIVHVLTHSLFVDFSSRPSSRGCSTSRQSTNERNGLMRFGEFPFFFFKLRI